jgi:hypothetical protein
MHHRLELLAFFISGRWRSACRTWREIFQAMGETVQKHLDKANSAWHALAVTFGSPRRRNMICRMLRYLVVTATLFYYSRNIASTSIRALLGGSF